LENGYLRFVMLVFRLTDEGVRRAKTKQSIPIIPSMPQGEWDAKIS
jgi:hypothetical protein